MKLLILSTATGQGHNTAALSIKEYLDTQDCETVIMDVLKSGKKDVSSRISSLYSNMTIHFPWLFGFLYHMGELVSSSRRHSPIFYLNALYARSLHEKICVLNPDVIVCTHIFSAQVITRIREKYGLMTPAVGIMTDYTCSPFWEETRLDAYIIPAKQLKNEFIQKGVPEDKIVPIGIPVMARFRNSLPKKEARAKFGLTAEHVFVIMGGSMGYGSIEKLSTTLLRLDPDAQVAALCGNNQKLYKRLSGMENVVPFEYIDNVDVLMDAADVLLTKPGGLSSTEALVKGVPIVFTCPIPGGETRNADFLSSLGMSVSANSVDEAAKAAINLLNDHSAVNRMLEAQNEQVERETNKKIGEFLLKVARKAKSNSCNC